MRYLRDVKTAAKYALAVVVFGGLGVFFGATTSAQQAGTDVNVRVCPVVPNASLVITAPNSDSKTNDPKITIEGDVEYISQIDFFVDDVYDHTIALGFATTAFRSTVTVAPGTHTIKLEAIDSCSPEPLVEEIVITYEPTSTPTDGSDVVTDIPSLNNNTPPGGVIGIPIINFPGSEDDENDGDDMPVTGGGTSKPGDKPDKQSPQEGDRKPRHSNLDIGTILGDQRLDVWLRAMTVVLGVILLFAPWRVLSVTDYIRQGLVDHIDKQVTPHAQHPHIRLAGRFVGAIFIALAFLV